MGDQFNVFLKQEGATAADGAVTHCHLYRYTTGTDVVKLAGVEHLPPVRHNIHAEQVGDDMFLGWPVALGDGSGTVTTAGSTTVTCSGSFFTTAYGVVAGYLILIEGETQWHEIASVDSATQVTLSAAASSSGASRDYVIAPRGGIKLEGGDANLIPRWIGIKAPGTAATAVEANTGGSLTSAVDGDYRFKYTYMNDAKHESNVSPVQAAATTVAATGTDKVTVTLTAITPADAQVVKYRLYADKDASGNFYFVKQGDWTTEVTVTTDAELTLTGEQEGPTDNDAPLFCCSTFAQWERRVFGAGDPLHPNWLYFTEQGETNQEGFPINLRTSEHWHVEFSRLAKITALYTQGGRLLVFGDRMVYSLAGYKYVTDDYNAPTQSNMSPVRVCPDSGVGCVAPDTVVDVDGDVWFWSHLGLYRMRRGGCPQLVTRALDAITARVTKANAYLSTAAFDLKNKEYVMCLPVDDSTTPNLTVRVNTETLAVMVDDVEIQCVALVKDDEVHALSHTGVIHTWDTAATYTDGLLESVGQVAAGCTTTSIVATAVFTSYTSSWGTLSGSMIQMLTGDAAGEIREILDVDDANTMTVSAAFSAAPAEGDMYAIGGINFEYQFPWMRNEGFAANRVARLHIIRLFLEEQTTGLHTKAGARGSKTPGAGTWTDRTVNTVSKVEAVSPIGKWGRYVQARVRNYWPGEHVVLVGASMELSQ